MRIPETRYARTVDGLSIAYQTAGHGPIDVIFMRAWHTNVEFDWEWTTSPPYWTLPDPGAPP
jgi:hypothetical protein